VPPPHHHHVTQSSHSINAIWAGASWSSYQQCIEGAQLASCIMPSFDYICFVTCTLVRCASCNNPMTLPCYRFDHTFCNDYSIWWATPTRKTLQYNCTTHTSNFIAESIAIDPAAAAVSNWCYERPRACQLTTINSPYKQLAHLSRPAQILVNQPGCSKLTDSWKTPDNDS
jgi:hypothetical protein